MGLTIKEKIGAVIAFIPLASTISGLIKAIIYYKKTKKEPANAEKMNNLAEKTNKTSLRQLSNFETECHNKLFKASIAEMIPLINVIAAVYSAFVLSDLSEVRELQQNPEGDKVQEKILQLNNIRSFNDQEKDKLMFDVINSLDENEEDLIHFCYGVITAVGTKWPAENIVKFARQDAEESKKAQEAGKEKEKNAEDILRQMQEKSRKSLEDIKNGIINLPELD